ncbi:MAG: hypothetical protein IT377_11810 [Polyangiaceae bacterium]|nr:hypothetical protein [Polyangiaceae bacterium]
MRLVGWLSVTVLALAVSSNARAQACAEDPATCGRQEFESGIEAYQAKDWAKAATHFEAAQKLRPHPVVLFNWALAESRLEHYVAALAHFDQVLADPETPKSLLPQIESEKANAQKNVATLEIEAAAGAEVVVDDRKIDGNPPVASVDPGEHRVRVTLDGKIALDTRLRVRAGERLRIAVDRTREVVVPPPTSTAAPPPPPPPPEAGPSPIWFYAGAGLTAVLGGVTVWSALDTQRAFDDYERDLPKSTQAEADARVAAGHDKELRTNLLIGATALAAVGTAALGLFVVDFSGKQQPRAGLFLGPTGISAAGQF